MEIHVFAKLQSNTKKKSPKTTRIWHKVTRHMSDEQKSSLADRDETEKWRKADWSYFDPLSWFALNRKIAMPCANATLSTECCLYGCIASTFHIISLPHACTSHTYTSTVCILATVNCIKLPWHYNISQIFMINESWNILKMVSFMWNIFKLVYYIECSPSFCFPYMIWNRRVLCAQCTDTPCST